MPANDATWGDVWKRPAVLLTPLATIVAVGVAACGVSQTIESNNDSERRRERAAAKLAAQDTERSFQLTAVQIVMSQRTCKLAQARAKTLVLLFPKQLRSVLAPLTRTPSATLCKQLQTSSGGGTGGGLPFLLPFFP